MNTYAEIVQSSLPNIGDFVSDNSIIERAMNYPMDDIISRYSSEHGVSLSEAKRHEVEIKRFLILCAMNKEVTYGMSGVVDNLWHVFIIFTFEYHEFCNLIAGRYLHHKPNVNSEDEDNRHYLNTMIDYERIFKEKPSQRIWPSPYRNNILSDCESVHCSSCTQSPPKFCSG